MPDLNGKKVVYLGYCGPIDGSGVTRISQTLNAAVLQGFETIYLCFTSPGGYVGDSVYLYHHIKGLPVPIICHNTGTIASCATTLFVGAEHRICSKHAIFMIHPVSVGARGQFMAIEPLQASLNAAIADEERTEAILRAHCKFPDGVLADRRQTDVYLTADKALEYGLVHEIAEFSLPTGHQVVQI